MPGMSRRAAIAAAAATVLAPTGRTRAQPGKPVRIGVSNDASGLYADIGGPGSAAAVRLAVEEVGGTVLGRPIEVLHGDNQNKADVASNLARTWYDTMDCELIVDGAATTSGLATLQVAREKRKIYLVAGPASSDFTGKLCSPYHLHFAYDTYVVAHITGEALTRQGGSTWFFLTADYAFGHALERDTTKFVQAAGGKVLGGMRHPLGTSDFSTYLIQARASGAKVIGLANAGGDLQNAIKQAAEFGIVKGGQRMAALLVFSTDVAALGLPTAQGLVLTETFYWDLNDETRAWTRRFRALRDQIPCMVHAANYSAARHWLAAVKAAGTFDAETVMATMRATPINDMNNRNVAIREDGRVLHTAYLCQAKAPSESKGKDDIYKVLQSVPGQDAFRPLAESECPMVKKT